MKKASIVMYVIGTVVAIVNLAFFGLLLMVPGFKEAQPDAFNELVRQLVEAGITEEQIKLVLDNIVMIGYIGLGVTGFFMILAIISIITLARDARAVVLHVLMIIGGLVTSLWYVLGGIFGAIASGRRY